MGDCALIQVVDKHGHFSPVVYLHWGGYRVEEVLGCLKGLMKDRKGDVDYTSARLVGICHNMFEGDTGLGMWNADAILTESDSHGDAGCFLFNCDTFETECFGGYGLNYDAYAD